MTNFFYPLVENIHKNGISEKNFRQYESFRPKVSDHDAIHSGSRPRALVVPTTDPPTKGII